MPESGLRARASDPKTLGTVPDACLTQKTARGFGVDSSDQHALVAGSFAADDRNAAKGHGKEAREEGEGGIVGGAVDRRRRDAEKQRAISNADGM